MKFGAGPAYPMSPSEWNHRGGVGSSGVLNGKAGGNMCYLDGHVAWMSDPAELMRHRQRINGNDNRSYAAEQKNDP
jgi:prepilin-type processing-associated H-X9-DG protein